MKTTSLVGLLIVTALAPMLLGSQPISPEYVPCRVHRNVTGSFPLRALLQGITRGEASVVIEVDGQGVVSDRLLTAYTHRAFGEEAMRTVGMWTFEPGTYRGGPVISVLTVNFEFTTNGILVYERHTDAVRLEDYLAGKFGYFAHGPETLDGKPVAVSTVSPAYPQDWIAAGRRGKVTVRFFIDEAGRTRMPITTDTPDPLLGAAATEAIKNWRFRPLTADGKPVLAIAEMSFVFEPPGSEST